MTKEIKILINYLLYILLFIGICIVGISNVFAVEIGSTDYSTKYYWYITNDNSSITSTDYRTGSDNRLTLFGPTAPTYDNSEGFNGFYNRINYTLSKGSIYTLTLFVNFNGIQESEFSSNNVTNRLLSTDFAHCSDCTITAVSGSTRRYNSTNQGISNLYDYVVQMSYSFVANSNVNQWYIGSYTGDDRTLGLNIHAYTATIIVSGLTISNDNSSTIINQNDTIINQNQQMIDQSQQNTQDIINNQNQNTEQQIESQKVCTEIDKDNILNKNTYLNNGVETSTASALGTTDYINVYNSDLTLIKTYQNNITIACFYNVNKTFISCLNQNQVSVNQTVDLPNNTYYAKFVIFETWNQPTWKLCRNGNQALNDSINDLNDSLTDSSSIDVSSIGNTVGWLPSGPIDSIINLPLNFFNSLSTALSGTCSALTINLPYVHENVTIPCLSSIFSEITGLTTFWNWVGRIASIYILYKYLLALWDYYDRLTTMQVNFRDDFGGGV